MHGPSLEAALMNSEFLTLWLVCLGGLACASVPSGGGAPGASSAKAAIPPAAAVAAAKAMRCKSPHQDAKDNLKNIFYAQKSWMAEHDHFASLETIVGNWEPQSRYTVCNGPDDCRSCYGPAVAAKRKAAAREALRKSRALNALSATLGGGVEFDEKGSEGGADAPPVEDLCNGIGPTQQACKVPAGYTGKGTPFKELKFSVCATANLDDDDTLDVWSLNDRNELVHEVNDCAD